MMLLLDLPTDISITVLTDWVACLKSLSVLDVAIGHAHRREWLALIQDPAFILSRTPQAKSEESVSLYVQWVNTRLTKMETLAVSVAHVSTFMKMSYVVLRRVTSLELSNSIPPKMVRPDHMRSLLMLLPALTCVDLCRAGKDVERLVSAQLSTMPHLRLKHMVFADDETGCDALALSIGMFCQSLLTLKLVGTITAALLKLVSEKCVNLLSLTINIAEDISSQVINDSLASDGLPLLTKLIVWDGGGVISDEVALAIFAKHPILTHFTCTEAAEPSLSIFTCALALEHCPNLISYVSDVTRFEWYPKGNCCILHTELTTPAAEPQFATELTKLVRLRRHPIGEIDCVDELSNASVLSIAANCPNLTLADLHVRTDVNDATINTLVLSCALLENLSLYHCRGITDKSLKAIADNCVHITSLHWGKE